MNKNTLAVALAALLVGGVAVAAYQSNRQSGIPAPATQQAALQAGATTAVNADTVNTVAADTAANNGIAPTPVAAAYADVVDVKPVTSKEQLYATVIDTDPISETNTTSTPRQVCENVPVQQRMPERDGNVGGTVIGAVVGGLVGNQVGKGNGRKLATVAGAVGGGFAGREIDKRHVGGKVVTTTQQQCHTVSDSSTSSRVVAYNVTYRNPDGTTGTQRMTSKPGSRIALGQQTRTAGYDVTYRYDGQERTVRMDRRPAGDRLPVVDGRVVTQTAAMDDGTARQ